MSCRLKHTLLLSAAFAIANFIVSPYARDDFGAAAAMGASPKSSSHSGPKNPQSKPPKKHGPRQSRSKDGTYFVMVNGFWHGTGTADVRSDHIVMKVDLVSDDGSAAKLNGNVDIDGPYFSGTIRLSGRTGQDVYITGRLDAARASRLIGNFQMEDGCEGRMFGTLPASVDPGDDHWEEHDH